MTTVTASTTYAKITAEAGGAAKQLRERLKTVVQGSTDATADTDMRALATMLETAAAAATSLQDGRSYTLSWSTSGSNDATTKAVATAWVYGSPSPPHCGLYHGHVPARLAPKLGDDLLTMIGGL